MMMASTGDTFLRNSLSFAWPLATPQKPRAPHSMTLPVYTTICAVRPPRGGSIRDCRLHYARTFRLAIEPSGHRQVAPTQAWLERARQ